MLCPVVIWCLMSAASIVTAREAKWFFSKTTVTHYVQQKPSTSSCVVVEETLKPCRNLRQIKATGSYFPSRILMTAAPRMTDKIRSPSVVRSSKEPVRTWGSFLGLGQVTQTITHILPARTLPASAMVTFSVRGCKPSRLPFDLPICSATNTTDVVTARVSPTKAVHFVEE